MVQHQGHSNIVRGQRQDATHRDSESVKEIKIERECVIVRECEIDIEWEREEDSKTESVPERQR